MIQWRYRLGRSRTSDSHSENTGSNPVSATKISGRTSKMFWQKIRDLNLFPHHD